MNDKLRDETVSHMLSHLSNAVSTIKKFQKLAIFVNLEILEKKQKNNDCQIFLQAKTIGPMKKIPWTKTLKIVQRIYVVQLELAKTTS